MAFGSLEPSYVARHLAQTLRLAEYELTLFAAFWFVIDILDELLVDIAFVWFRFTGRAKTVRLGRDISRDRLRGRAAVFIPAWREADVVGLTVAHLLRVWPQRDLRLYVGCYANDPDTLRVAMEAAAGDPRLRLVVHGQRGPTTKGDCLNRLYRALCHDEAMAKTPARLVMIHDAEDMVHPAELALVDEALEMADFIQIPVRPEPARSGGWIAGHYMDEFAEAHAKALVVRDAMGAPLPAAGVGCTFSRRVLERMAAQSPDGAPFASDCLTEDYELGMVVSLEGVRRHFLRVRDATGALVATRCCFPDSLPAAVCQKTRWLHGIAFQGWDRLGWKGRLVDRWMTLRDRKAPFATMTLGVAYLLLGLTPFSFAVRLQMLSARPMEGAVLKGMLAICLFGFVWRAMMRAIFTGREYGAWEGMRAIIRIPIANVIAIMAFRRAFAAYCRSLFGAPVLWDKTLHRDHPAMAVPRPAAT